MKTNHGTCSENRGWSRIAMRAALVLCLAVACFPESALANDVSIEHKIKAAFTFNFIKYIDWTEKGSDPADSEFVISIIGDGPINSALAELENKEVFGKPLKVRFVSDLESAGPSNVYFINVSVQEELDSIFQKARQWGVLTVGEMDEFCERGGIINFVILDDSIHFEINQKEAQRAHLSISYKLLNQASRVIR